MIQRNFRRYKSCPRKLNVTKFKRKFRAVIQGWKVRRIFAILRNDEKTSEAMEIIKLNEDTKQKGENLFFKQLTDKFPEMMQLFHERLNELLESDKWPQKPVVKVKVLVSFENHV